MICQELGFDCVVLHSLIRQKERLAALARFKSNQAKILIATDVASRYGLVLDFEQLYIAFIILKILSCSHYEQTLYLCAMFREYFVSVSV